MPDTRQRRSPFFVPGVLGLVGACFSGIALVRSHVRDVHAQTINVGQPAPAKKGHVIFLADPQTLPAGKPATLKLRFRIDPGFHINSHTPKSDLLIPTKLAVAEIPGDADVVSVDFPAGTPYAFAFEPKQKLDVYQDEVVLTAHLKGVPAGQHSLKAELRYQACDQAACYPPAKLSLEQPYTAR